MRVPCVPIMSSVRRSIGSRLVLERSDFPRLLEGLGIRGYVTVGPVVRDGAIVYGPISRVEDLPIGWTDRQEAGTYRLERRDDGALFGYTVGPHSWKKYLFPAHERLWTAERSPEGFHILPRSEPEPRYAFLGVRACELAAIRIQDRVFDGAFKDPGYHQRRSEAFRIAVQCTQAGNTCFCASMGTGPRVEADHDLALTEILTGSAHYFLVDVGSERGAELASDLPLRPATEADVRAVDDLLEKTTKSMGRTMNAVGLRDLLLGRPEHSRWTEVGKRCLTCTNCTLACPTCFCSTTEEVPDLDADRVERWRRWDSCFTLGFTHQGRASVRTSASSRYRQWLTHKLASWHDQFGTSGCVGCGRCITWCPVGIDITEEVAALRKEEPVAVPAGGAR